MANFELLIYLKVSKVFLLIYLMKYNIYFILIDIQNCFSNKLRLNSFQLSRHFMLRSKYVCLHLY